MTETDRIADVVFNAAAKTILWTLGVLFFWTIQPRRADPCVRSSS